MKKWIGILLTVILLAFCASAPAETSLQALIDANVASAVCDVYPSIALRTAFYNVDTGEAEDSSEVFLVNNPATGLTYRFVYPNGSVQYFGNGGGYGYAGASKQPYVCCFIANAYEEYTQTLHTQNIGEFADWQTITAEETTSGGRLLITTEGVITEDVTGFESFMGSTMVARYTVDPENLIIESAEAYIRGVDGEEKKYLVTSVERDPQIPDPPFDLTAITNPAAVRELYIVMDPGTDAEATYTLTAPIDLPMSLFPPDGYALYEDAACTELSESITADENGHYPDKDTLYCAKEAPAQ